MPISKKNSLKNKNLKTNKVTNKSNKYVESTINLNDLSDSSEYKLNIFEESSESLKKIKPNKSSITNSNMLSSNNSISSFKNLTRFYNDSYYIKEESVGENSYYKQYTYYTYDTLKFSIEKYLNFKLNYEEFEYLKDNFNLYKNISNISEVTKKFFRDFYKNEYSKALRNNFKAYFYQFKNLIFTIYIYGIREVTSVKMNLNNANSCLTIGVKVMKDLFHLNVSSEYDVLVEYKTENGLKTAFIGKVDFDEYNISENMYYIKFIDAIGYNIRKKTLIYQEKTLTYLDIVKDVFKNCTMSKIIKNILNVNILYPVIKPYYTENAFQFIKRLLSQFNQYFLFEYTFNNGKIGLHIFSKIDIVFDRITLKSSEVTSINCEDNDTEQVHLNLKKFIDKHTFLKYVNKKEEYDFKYDFVIDSTFIIDMLSPGTFRYASKIKCIILEKTYVPIKIVQKYRFKGEILGFRGDNPIVKLYPKDIHKNNLLESYYDSDSLKIKPKNLFDFKIISNKTPFILSKKKLINKEVPIEIRDDIIYVVLD